MKDKDQEISRLKARLTQCENELEDFTYVVSHDLRAPLRGILSLANWLKEDYSGDLDQQGLQYLDKMMERTRRMNGMLESILKLSRIGRSIPHPVKMDCRQVVETVVINLAPPPNIAVSINGQLPEIFFDKGYFTQIMENLIDNAIQHLGKPEGTIGISCKLQTETEWEFCVTDDGAGIEPKHFELIFKMFRNLSPSQEGESKGVGLTLVKRILNHIGGDIRVQSELGEGSAFFFTIPRSQS